MSEPSANRVVARRETPDPVTRLAGEVLLALQQDAHKALSLAEELNALAQRTGDRTAIARASWVRGHALCELLRHDEATKAYAQAQRLYRLQGEHHEAALVCLGQINVLRKVGRSKDALRVGESARATLLRHGDRRAVVRLDVNLAAIFQQHEQRIEALGVYDRALRIARQVDDEEMQKLLQYNRATVLGHLGRLQDARDIYDTLRSTMDAAGESRMVGVMDYGTGCVARQAGDYELAYRHLSAARDRFEEIDASGDLLQTELELAALLLRVGSSRRGLDFAKRGVDAARRHGLHQEEARGTLLVGSAMLSMGRLKSAEQILERARKELIEVKLPVSGALCEMQLAEIAARGGRLDLAREKLGRAHEVLQAERVRPLRVDALLRRSWVELRLAALEDAKQTLLQAKALARSLPAGDHSAHAAFLAGRLAEADRRPGMAVRHYRRAVKELERTRDRIDADELRWSHGSGRSQAFDDLVRLLVQRATKAAWEEAYGLVERSKTQRWVEGVGSQLSPRRLARSEQSLLVGARIENLRASLRVLYGAHRGVDDCAQPVENWKARRNTIARQEAQLADLHQRLEHIEAREGIASRGTPLTAEETCRRLPSGVTLVAYHVGEDSTYAFVLQRRGCRVVDLGIGEERWESEISRLRFCLEKWGYGEEYLQGRGARLRSELGSRLADLSRRVWQPLGIDTKEVWVVPHGPIHQLPFEALPLGDDECVLDQHHIVRLASCGFRQGRSARLVPRSVLEAWPTADGKRAAGRALVVGVDHPELPDLGRELRAVQRALEDSTTLRNGRARRVRFIEEGVGADLIHIATHGMHRAEDPFFSALELGDGWLSLYDVYRLRLRARLVTLSSCPVTGPVAGREQGGLPRGLFRAGARALLLSQWSVGDRNTARFMGRFYRGLGRGESAATALRAAMVQTRRESPDPYYWAPFALYGSCEV